MLKISSKNKSLYKIFVYGKYYIVSIYEESNKIFMEEMYLVQEWLEKRGLAPSVTAFGKRYIIQEYIHEESQAIIGFEQYGSFIGKVHTSLFDFPKKIKKFRSMNMPRHEIFYDKLENEEDVLLTKIIELQKEIGNLPNLLKDMQKFYQLIHGDLHKRNLILSEDNKLKIIDFDQITYFPASYDVLRFYFESINYRDIDTDLLNLKKYLIAYSKINILAPEEWNLALLFYYYILINDISMFKTNYSFFSKRVNRAIYINKNFIKIQNVIQKITNEKG